MAWSQPRVGKYLSNKFYQIKYTENIKNYNWKLTKLLDTKGMNHFCSDTLSKTNKIPIHCLEILWNHITNFEIFLTNNPNYISVVMEENILTIGINLEQVLKLGLATEIILPTIKLFFTDKTIADKCLNSSFHKLFLEQYTHIHANFNKYFGE